MLTVKAGLLVVLVTLLAVHGAHSSQNENKEVRETLKAMKGELASLQSQLNLQQHTHSEELQALQQVNHMQRQQINNLKHIVTASPSLQFDQTDFGCFSELITLWCFDGGVINVTGAYYGQYNTSCDQGECCMPDQVDDCRVSVVNNRPSDWLGLKVTCDNRTSCSYEYLGSAIDECEENYLADYMQIYYSCGEDNQVTYDPVGFSAYAIYDYNYGYYDTIFFEGVISNIGGAYDEQNSTFTCPRHGVYLFSLSVKTDYSSNVYLELKRNGETIAEAFGDGYNDYATAAAVVVLECEAGHVVWVSSGNNYAQVQGDSNRQSLFTGYMLYPYD